MQSFHINDIRVISFNPGISQNITLHASLAPRRICHSYLPIPFNFSFIFFLALGVCVCVTNAFSDVGRELK